MSNRALDEYLARENHINEVACCDCGYHRGSAHHPGIVCPKTGRCGQCGNDWPCAEHIGMVKKKPARRKHSKSGQARCEICSPLRCSKAP